ncbi:MAG: nucleotidyltransferase family protein [Selenomonadaceae bacterium]|nr:nucleotidyltransferase family protein [Selenomonadaceae bacterium]
MEAIVLAGGFGTRLRHVVSDVPKPMAPMNDAGKPFLEVLLTQLAGQGVKHVVLSTGYMSEVIEQYFGKTFAGMKLEYSVEDTPLLTGGAVKMALERCTEPDIFVLNGDTYFAVDLSAMLAHHRARHADFTIAVKHMHDFERYGTVVYDESGIQAFHEKAPCHDGWINGGVYCLQRHVLEKVAATKFSLEKDFLEQKIDEIDLQAFPAEGYFIDIGVPEDYYQACRRFQS